MTPHREDGDKMDPHVSVPMEKGTSPAAVAEAEPADDPEEPCSISHGFRVFPLNHTSPLANAPEVSFAIRIAPAEFNF